MDHHDIFTLTAGIRYAEDDITAEENLFRYTETLLGAIAIADLNLANGGLVPNGDGTYSPVQDRHVQGGWPIAVSVYRPFDRKDDDITWRINLDWDITDAAMMYFGVTTGYRSGGYNLVFFSNTPTYDPEDLTAYEIGYKTQWFDDRLQVNGSFYYYDYENIHTVGTEVTYASAALTTSVLAAPGAEIYGIEAEATWLATDRLTLGGNFSWTPSEYTEGFLHLSDPSGFDNPNSLFPGQDDQLANIKGNQLLQVPEGKATAWGSYRYPAARRRQPGSLCHLQLDFRGVLLTVRVGGRERRMPTIGSTYRATFTSGNGNWIISGFVNNVFDDVGVLQVLREGEDLSSTVTPPVPPYLATMAWKSPSRPAVINGRGR